MRKLLIALFLALPAFSQQQQPTFFSETIEVRVINVDVIVTKDGKPATGLTKDDFQILEDGKPQAITNFLEVREEEAPRVQQPGAPAAAPVAPTDPRARNIVVFLDMTTMAPLARDRVFEPMSKFIQHTTRAGDHVMIVSWNPGLKVDLPFTNDVAAATSALKRLIGTVTATAAKQDLLMAEHELSAMPGDYATQTKGAIGGAAATPTKPPMSEGRRVAEAYGDKITFEQSQRVEAMKSVMASLRGVSGHNALVILTDQLSRNPALPIFTYLEGMKDRFDGGETFVAANAAQRFEQGSMVKEISDAANSTGVTLYPISASGLGIDMGGVDASHLGNEYYDTSRPMARSDSGLMAMTQIAAATGGKALTGSNNFELAFNTLTQDMTSYYSLGYHPAEGDKKDAVRSISVKLRKKGYEVRSRESFVEKSLTSEMQDAVSANLFYPVTRNDLNISIAKGANPPSHTEQGLIVPVVVKIPTVGLTLIPDGSDVVGQFTSFTAFTHRDGKVSEVKRTQHQLRFPADSVKRRKEITVKYDLIVDESTDNVSVGVMDDASHAMGFAALSGITNGITGAVARDAGHK
ncbi:MAG TPA: VWA domain-containing protein, partial [Thermoanaerobaculia bacterium]|nr:VWA domain-containing protein [Thermoanaerobaculia bacterium]